MDGGRTLTGRALRSPCGVIIHAWFTRHREHEKCQPVIHAARCMNVPNRARSCLGRDAILLLARWVVRHVRRRSFLCYAYVGVRTSTNVWRALGIPAAQTARPASAPPRVALCLSRSAGVPDPPRPPRPSPTSYFFSPPPLTNSYCNANPSGMYYSHGAPLRKQNFTRRTAFLSSPHSIRCFS